MNSALPALEHFGIPVANRDQLRVFVGPPLRQTFARFGVPEAGIEEAIRIFRARYIPRNKFEKLPPRHRGPAGPAAGRGFLPVCGHFQAPGHRHRGAGALSAGPPLHPDLRGRPRRGRETKADVIAHLLAQIKGRPAVMVGTRTTTCWGQGPRHPHHRGPPGGMGGCGHAGRRRGGAGTPEALHTYLQAFAALPAGSPSTFLERSPRYGKQ